MRHDPPADAGKGLDVGSTPCAVWALGWTCPNRVKGIDGSRVCPDCRPKLPPPPYGDQGQFSTWPSWVWHLEAEARARRHPAPTVWLGMNLLDGLPPPTPAPAAAPTPVRTLAPPVDPKADVGSFDRSDPATEIGLYPGMGPRKGRPARTRKGSR